jgi:hypothetical protein
MSEEAKALQEAAKAVQEVAKTSVEAIEASEQFGRWLDRVFGEAIAESVGRLWTDRVRASRIASAIYDWERLTMLLHNVDKKLRKRGIKTTRAVPPKIALPLLEHATMENEDELHELWEALLAQALDPTEDDVTKVYVSVLSEFSGRETRVLKQLYAEWTYWEEQRSDFQKKTHERYSSGVSASEHESSVILLYRLGMVLPVHVSVEEYRNQSDVRQNTWSAKEPPLYVEGGDKMQVLGDLKVIAFTEFGERFCKAVIGDVKGLYTPPSWKRWSGQQSAPR